MLECFGSLKYLEACVKNTKKCSNVVLVGICKQNERLENVELSRKEHKTLCKAIIGYQLKNYVNLRTVLFFKSSTSLTKSGRFLAKELLKRNTKESFTKVYENLKEEFEKIEQENEEGCRYMTCMECLIVLKISLETLQKVVKLETEKEELRSEMMDEINIVIYLVGRRLNTDFLM